MQAVSERFLLALRQSHLIACQADVYFPGETLPIVLPITDGGVTIDRTAQVRRTGSIRIPWSLEDGESFGVDVRTLPLGGYVKLKRGIRFGADDVELVTLGHLRVESVTWGTNDQEAQLELADRMAQVRDDLLRAPWSATGKRAAQAAADLVYEVFGTSIAYDVRYNPSQTVLDVVYSGSRLDAVMELARSIGGEAYFDADGDFVLDIASAMQSITRDGVVADDSTDITGLSSTDDLAVGMTVTGKGIPAGRTIAAILSSTSIRMSAPANTYAIKDGTWTANSPWVTGISDTSDMTVGMTTTENPWIIVEVVPGAVRMNVNAWHPSGSGSYRNPFHWYFAGETNPGHLLTTPITFAGPATQYPVYTVDAGDAGILVAANEALDRSRTYNGVLVRGQNSVTSAQFAVLVVDADAASPTYWGGPFGRVTRIEDSNAVQSSAQAQVMAGALLNEGLALTRTLTLEAAPNPALVAGDVLSVAFPDGRVEQHVVDAIRVPLGTGPVVIQTRTTALPAEALTRDGRRWTPFPQRRTRVLHDAAAWRELRRRPVVERIRERQT